MSIAVGVYDFFAYTLPGGLYLLFFWLICARLDAAPAPSQIASLSTIQVVVLGVLSYLLGLLAAPLSWNKWFLLFGPADAQKAAFERVRRTYPNVDLQFSANQWPVLQGRLALEHRDALVEVHKHRATYIMLRSTSFALLLLSVLEMLGWLQPSGIEIVEVMKAVLAALFLLFLSALAARQSHKFADWSHSLVYELTIAQAMEPADFVHKIEVAHGFEAVREAPTAEPAVRPAE